MAAKTREIRQLITPQPVMEGAGVRLKRSIATPTLNYLDPFLLFDHFGSENPADYLAGFPMHPHRGIETVTYMLAGKVNHRDSLGNAGTIGPGDLQWMTAGGGIMHEEMPVPLDGRMEGFQLWVNLPAKLKMTRPRYQEIPSAQIPEVTRENGVKIRVIAGQVNGTAGAVTEIAADPSYLDVHLPAGTSFTHQIPRDHTVFAYLYEGKGTFGEAGSNAESQTYSPRLIILDEGELVQATAGEQPMRFLLVSGRPLHEPIARYGPFVMNTPAEIQQALFDLQNGTFVMR